jgi:uncharacterized protein (DUF983 family)
MKLEASCPVCRSPITLGNILSASTPSRIYCKKCGTRLRPDDDVRGIMNVIFVIVGVIAFVMGFVLMTLYLDEAITVTVFILILAIIVIPLVIVTELYLVYLVSNKSRLVPAT